MSAPIIFMDTETTGLEHDADIWEFGAIRREVDGTETELHLFIEHDYERCHELPPLFFVDHARRYDPEKAATQQSAARLIAHFIGTDRPHIVGAVPDFDTNRVARLLRKEGHNTINLWHHHIMCAEVLALGWLKAHGQTFELPWISDDLSRALGVEVDEEGRHTALGDARWAMRMYDAVMS